ncbi:MAG: DUF6273 domain-containing protein [Oscillospiraceae bacterium]|nr:DUF6273 domain-containing protein [Oscillospiraceae bacterium]
MFQLWRISVCFTPPPPQNPQEFPVSQFNLPVTPTIATPLPAKTKKPKNKKGKKILIPIICFLVIAVVAGGIGLGQLAKNTKVKKEYTASFAWAKANAGRLQGELSGTGATLSDDGIVHFGGYDWIVLAVEDDRALLLSQYTLKENANYNFVIKETTWEDCSLRQYLNGEFLNSFPAAERSRILSVSNKNEDNQRTGADGGNTTTDNIFLLSISEVVQYFGDSGALSSVTMPKDDTDAISSYYSTMYRNNPENFRLDDQYNEARRAISANLVPSEWWLRSPGTYVDQLGYIQFHGFSQVYIGVRPAFWLDLR